jgi:hypothetical protein
MNVKSFFENIDEKWLVSCRIWLHPSMDDNLVVFCNCNVFCAIATIYFAKCTKMLRSTTHAIFVIPNEILK